MKIKSVKATPVRVPATRVGIMSREKRTHAARTIVEIETTCGLLGLGETRGEWSSKIIQERFAEELKGMDPLQRDRAKRVCLTANFDDGFPEQLLEQNAFAAIDLALWDIAGKYADEPVFDLLGGLAREAAPFVAYAYAVDPDDGYPEQDIPRVMAEVASNAIARSGSQMFEFKVGRYSVGCEIETIRQVRSIVGNKVDLAIDANKGFTFDQASKLLEGVADIRLSNFEEPVKELAEIEELRKRYDVSMSTHCVNMDALRHYPRLDAVVSDLHLHGGISSTLGFIESVSKLGKNFWLRSTWELGISWAAMCHVALAVREMKRPSQTLIDWVEDDLLINSDWKICEGAVKPVNRAGLGVELNRDALQKYMVQ